MLNLPPNDEALSSLVDRSIASDHFPHVRYDLSRRLGGGGMASVFVAVRRSPEGESQVVLKVLRPDFVLEAGAEAAKVAMKEAVALGRLGECVPHTPFVVRLIETGVVRAQWSGETVALPWFALEYVHGGPAGTTLTERVGTCLRETGRAFGCARASRAIHSLAEGLTAVHEVGVIHRDFKPDNVLCCGMGADEMFKVADFGIARPSGVSSTFYGESVGTPGYAAPEMIDAARDGIGAWTDVFAFAGVIFFLLTGEEYFSARGMIEAMAQAMSPVRRSLLDAAGLPADVREREAACKAVDAALAQATDRRPSSRPQSARALAASVLPWLRSDSWRDRKQASAPAGLVCPATTSWSWLVRRNGSPESIVRSAAWDVDGTCLVATTNGIAFWDGTTLRDAPAEGLPAPSSARFVTRLGTGRWLIACEGSTFATYAQHGVQEVIRFSEESTQLQLFDGDIGDVAVGVAGSAQGPSLLALSGRRWLKPLPVPDAAAILALARVEDTRWLVAGRGRDGGGWVGVYSPLDWELQRLDAPPTRAMMACAGDRAACIGVAAGADGAVVSFHAGSVFVERLPQPFDASAAAVDPSGAAWLAGAGIIALRQGSPGTECWQTVWQVPEAAAPIVSMCADTGLLRAMTADGGVYEGRAASPCRQVP